jgi:hypothetical protein
MMTAAEYRLLAAGAWRLAEACYRVGGSTLDVQSHEQNARAYEALARKAPA